MFDKVTTVQHVNLDEPLVVVTCRGQKWFLAAQMAAFMQYGGKNKDPLKCMGSGVSSFISMGDPEQGTHMEEGIHFVSFNKKKERKVPAQEIQKYANDDINEMYRKGRVLLVSRQGLDLWMEKRMAKSPATVKLRQTMIDIYNSHNVSKQSANATFFQSNGNEGTYSSVVFTRNGEQFYELGHFLTQTANGRLPEKTATQYFRQTDDGLDHRVVKSASGKTYIRVKTAELLLDTLPKEAPQLSKESAFQNQINNIIGSAITAKPLSEAFQVKLAKALYQYVLMGEGHTDAIESQNDLPISTVKTVIQLLQVGALAFNIAEGDDLEGALDQSFGISRSVASQLCMKSGIYTSHIQDLLKGTSFYKHEVDTHKGKSYSTLHCFCGTKHSSPVAMDPRTFTCPHDKELVRVAKLLYSNNVPMNVIAETVKVTDPLAIQKMHEFLEAEAMKDNMQDPVATQ